MTESGWGRVRSVFESAVELPAGGRAAYLDQACGDDADLRSEVERLLRSAEQCGEFLETPAADELWGSAGDLGGGTPPDAELQGALGRYRVLRRIGRGGVGDVYLARNIGTADGAEVALKVIKRGMDSEFILTRFRLEREILASLDHPNIARFLDHGRAGDGRPFIVMEYVDGEPIHDYGRRRGLSLTAKLELFCEVCDAVSSAHRHLVVHRDLTPSNILVTDNGIPKLLDFGIAKLLAPPEEGDRAQRTATILRMLTPAYASPEQVSGGSITTSSDVYSLGVVLFEMLTGSRPYRLNGLAPGEIVRVVCEVPPERSAAFMALPSDLRNILLMALRKEPHRRYPSVDAFREDVRRYRVGLPVSARRATFGYRAGKFLRRNRTGVAVAGVLVLALTGGVVSTVWQARVAETERRLAERRYRDLRRLAGSLLFEFDEAIMDLAGSTAARELLVTRALEYLSALEAESVGDLSLQRDLAVAFSRVGEVQSRGFGLSVGDLSGALGSFHKAMVIRQALVDADADNLQDQDDLAESLLRIAQVMGAMCDPADDIQYARQAVTIRVVLADADPGNLVFKSGLAEAYETLGMALMRETDHSGTVASFESLRALREELLASNADGPTARCDLAEAIFDMGVAQALGGDHQSALANLEEARSMDAQLVAEYPASERYRRELMRVHTHLGATLGAMGRVDEALTEVRHGVAIGEQLLASDPANADVRHRLADAYRELGEVLIEAGSPHEAIRVLDKARGLLEEWWVANTANVQIAVTLAGVYEELGRAFEPIPGSMPAVGGQWRSARSWYQSSLDLWYEMAVRDRLARLYQSRPDRVAEAVVRCDEAIAAGAARSPSTDS